MATLVCRQEFAIHRWDLIGDDDEGAEILSRPELISHSVRMLREPLLAADLAHDAAASHDFTVRLRCAQQPDLVIEVHYGQGRLELAEPDDSPAVVETDPAARLLLLWGRRPSDPCRVRSQLPPPQLRRLQELLCGF